ncbi:MAG: carbohydrate-binding domain-containing protein, partial [Clostridia bacterium]|nr:carbohydrate-binding domain-containing protein [Clostridia bacterium]
MKKRLVGLVVLTLLLSGCGPKEPNIEGTQINLSDNNITVDGREIGSDAAQAVYSAKDIVFYLAGQDFTYGEGEKQDEHEQSEADAHTVVHITKPGRYVLSGTLSLGQIAIDLGEDAETDLDAVVTLVLNNVDITCKVAPAIIFYNVYECSNSDEETATKDVNTQKAGANVIVADGTENNINGSYVAKIYKSYELSEDGKEVVDSKKLHKYDGAFYSKKTMNINGGDKGTGVLNIRAENEGLDSELHLTINGGIINITSGNDGINTNEDNVSVTTV